MLQSLINPDVLQSVLASHKLRASKSLGQNFLICEEVLETVLMGLEDGPKKVTELGSGLGTLTQGLIGSGYQVRGIEKDDDFVKILPTIVPPKMRANLTVIHGDLLEIPWGWEGPWQLVGNIPYNISGLIIRLLTKIQIAPSSAILLMQKEVADRIVHSDNSMSLVGLSVGLWGTAELLLQVPPSCFIPAPAVHSSVIQIRPLPDMLPLEQRENIIAKAKPFFQAKRKQIAHTLKVAYGKDVEQVEVITKELNILPSARPENLSVQDWTALCDIL